MYAYTLYIIFNSIYVIKKLEIIYLCNLIIWNKQTKFTHYVVAMNILLNKYIIW